VNFLKRSPIIPSNKEVSPVKYERKLFKRVLITVIVLKKPFRISYIGANTAERESEDRFSTQYMKLLNAKSAEDSSLPDF
jgi:hypothetical protein